MTLRVAALEIPARWNDPARVLEDVAHLLASGPTPELVLLPEASITGYVSPALEFDLRPFAEPLTGPTATALSRLSRAHGCYLAGPLVELDGDRVYNATLVFAPDGARCAHYRKRHPWYPETWATAGGEAPPVFDVRGVRVTIAVCFDVHFLGQDAARELTDAHVLLFPSAWVERGDTRGAILPELARRFGVSVVNANWGAGVPRVAGQGGSRILGPDGALLAMAPGPGRVDASIP